MPVFGVSSSLAAATTNDGSLCVKRSSAKVTAKIGNAPKATFRRVPAYLLGDRGSLWGMGSKLAARRKLLDALGGAQGYRLDSQNSEEYSDRRL
jgi:hypothetical protein